MKGALGWIFAGLPIWLINGKSDVSKTIFASRTQVINWKLHSSEYLQVALKWLLISKT